MSTLMEDRLAAALRARADQVQPEDLQPLAVPVASLEARRGRAARRRRTVALAGLAAAACAAAVAGQLLLGDQGGNEAPQPAAPTEPRPTSSNERTLAAAATDVDGDGTEDAAAIVRTDGSLVLRVDLASGDRVEAPVRAGVEAALLTAGDVGGGPGGELVVPVSDRAHDLPLVYTWLGREGLVVASWPDVGIENWRPGNPQNRWTVRENGLRTWEAESVPGLNRYPYWDWTVDDEARLLPGSMQLGCAAPDDAPAPCRGEDQTGKASPAVGPRGDLPELLPAVTEVLRDEKFFYGLGPAKGEYAQLRGDFGEEGGAVDDGDVELVVTLMGVGPRRIPIPAGQSPRLVPQPLMLWGDAPAFVVQRSGGDTAAVELYSFWNGELVELKPQSDVFLGSGVIDHEGELTEQRTWITPDGQMFTALSLDWETGRHQLWQWDPNAGETISTIDLGEACFDWEAGDYGRCR